LILRSPGVRVPQGYSLSQTTTSVGPQGRREMESVCTFFLLLSFEEEQPTLSFFPTVKYNTEAPQTQEISKGGGARHFFASRDENISVPSLHRRSPTQSHVAARRKNGRSLRRSSETKPFFQLALCMAGVPFHDWRAEKSPVGEGVRMVRRFFISPLHILFSRERRGAMQKSDVHPKGRRYGILKAILTSFLEDKSLSPIIAVRLLKG
jgi:hypothetical protein